MLVKTLEIGWHEAKPIYSCDFQRRVVRTATGQVAHKFATAGADTHVRVSNNNNPKFIKLIVDLLDMAYPSNGPRYRPETSAWKGG